MSDKTLIQAGLRAMAGSSHASRLRVMGLLARFYALLLGTAVAMLPPNCRPLHEPWYDLLGAGEREYPPGVAGLSTMSLVGAHGALETLGIIMTATISTLSTPSLY
jgi:hypothetical protein